MPAVDPFLFHHLVESLHINIGGRLAPLSIRDQMTRGWLAVERAIGQGIIGADRKLMVIGAGVGGVTAAIAAAKAGVKVTLMDQAAGPFSRHASCRRWVDPTQYDWPVGHWHRASIPWPATPTLPNPPLTWPRADRANLLVGDWTTQLRNFVLTPEGRNLTEQYLWRCTAVTLLPASSLVRVDAEEVDRHGVPTGVVGHDDFGLVISAKGFGDERCFLELAPPHPWNGHPFRSFEFWANDPFERPGLGVPPRQGDEPRPRVLISGAGDGALQDFLRIMTRFKSAEEAWRQLGLPGPLVDEVAAIIRDAEDQATRALVWGAGADHDHDVLTRLERAHQQAVDLVFRKNPSITTTLAGIVRSEVAEIRLAHSCDHLGVGLGLNKFLVLLILEYLQKFTDYGASGPIRWSGRRVVEVLCQGHPTNPTPDPWMCHGATHEVTLHDEPDCRTRHASGTYPPPPPLAAPPPPGQTQHEFEVVILRHGIIAPDLRSKLDQNIRIKMGRQVMPYHYPA